MFVEVDNKRGLSRGMQGLQIRIAKALNKLWHRKGSIFADRYHASIPKGIRQIRRMMRYVLLNARKHGIPIPEGQPDRYSSGPFYPFWREYDQVRRPLRSPPVAWPQSIQTMCRESLRVSLFEHPGPRELVAQYFADQRDPLLAGM